MRGAGGGRLIRPTVCVDYLKIKLIIATLLECWIQAGLGFCNFQYVKAFDKFRILSYTIPYMHCCVSLHIEMRLNFMDKTWLVWFQFEQPRISYSYCHIIRSTPIKVLRSCGSDVRKLWCCRKYSRVLYFSNTSN